jgi:GTP-binding protein
LLIFVDLFSTEENNHIQQIKLLKKELSLYKEDLTQKVSWIVCNKIDLISDEEIDGISNNIQSQLEISKRDIFFISAATGEGTENLLKSLEEVIVRSKEELT